MLNDALNAVIGSTAKVRLLRALVPLVSPVSGREAGALAGVRSRSGVQQALTELAQLGILHEEQIRGARLYRVNRAHQMIDALILLFEAEQRRSGTLRDVVWQGLESKGLISAVHFVVLFGSVARGEARPDSDVDLLVVTGTARQNARVEDAMHDVAEHAERVLGARLSPLVMALPRLRQRHRAGDPLLHAIEAEGRVLLGASLHEMVRGGGRNETGKGEDRGEGARGKLSGGGPLAA